ncbi:restriction endonuclease subunit S [Lactobacillus porci]|uniref:restriction endonuclease subunit S n=1 Tax=Lactobacillus porci TaxID=2012477 RepID=UPI003996B141
MMEYELLKDIAKITMGQSPSSSSYNENGDGLPFFQGNADFGEVYPTVRIWCDNVKKVAHKDDILVSVRAPIGAVNMANHDCCIGRGLAAITVNKPEDREYIFRLLKAQNKKLNQMGTGSTFKAIGKKVLENIQVPILSKDEKIRAMQILKRIESLAGARKSQLFQLDSLVKARFVEMFGDVSKYELKSLAEVTEVIAGGDKPKDISENLTEEYCYPVYANGVANEGLQCYSKGYRVEKEAVTISARGTIGATFIRKPFFTPIVRLIAVVPNREVNVTYLKYAIDALRTSSTGSSQQQLTIPNVKKEMIAVPPLEKQKEFEQFVRQSDKSKVVVKKISKFHNISQEMCVND